MASGWFEVVAGQGGLRKLVVRNVAAGSACECYLHGAHVTSFRPATGAACSDAEDDVLFLSSRAVFSDNKAIRGGVPVCLPQFAGLGALPQHGFARVAEWTVANTEVVHGAGGDLARAVLQLHYVPSQAPAAWGGYPHKMTATMTLTLGATFLRMDLGVENESESPLEFTTALHTYFRTPDVRRTSVEGLAGLTYADKLRNNGIFVEDAATLKTLHTGHDRIYYNAPSQMKITTPRRVITLCRENFPDVILWNPWEEAKKMADMGPDDWTKMLCVESGAVAKPVTLAPGAKWQGSHTISATQEFPKSNL
eukprot:TRINITY_DN4261_c0_g1_i1.p1 TRINITY_DN4261_c0_g1~~TRINITY_DN4261_c0_g1_i1.p1  ORF type:complete len:317 (-),score=84.35 TRINITY_DN4261_c0_g1_i1:288-1214(-)